jgi:hypothetical protein
MADTVVRPRRCSFLIARSQPRTPHGAAETGATGSFGPSLVVQIENARENDYDYQYLDTLCSQSPHGAEVRSYRSRPE